MSQNQPIPSKSVGRKLTMNSALLFMHITCVIKDYCEMEEYLTYELAKQPPSLFDKKFMRRTHRCPCPHLRSHVTINLHSTSPNICALSYPYWAQDATIHDYVRKGCGNYLTDHCPDDCTIALGDYRGDLSTNIPNNSNLHHKKHLPTFCLGETWKSFATRIPFSRTGTTWPRLYNLSARTHRTNNALSKTHW